MTNGRKGSRARDVRVSSSCPTGRAVLAPWDIPSLMTTLVGGYAGSSGKRSFRSTHGAENASRACHPRAQPYFFDAQTAWTESGILDAIGKQKGLPVWRLFGEPVRDGVDPYDGTMYFEDIARHTGVEVIAEIGRRIKTDGYRAIKIKLGRPDKWLPGLLRDIEAFIALREAVGNNFNLMADANNGYRDKFEWAVTFLKFCAPYSMYFMEELFPDDTPSYVRLRESLLAEDLHVPIAEGENIRDMDIFDSYLRAGIYSYIQPDMRFQRYPQRCGEDRAPSAGQADPPCLAEPVGSRHEPPRIEGSHRHPLCRGFPTSRTRVRLLGISLPGRTVVHTGRARMGCLADS